jgi:hypothetical protein
MLRPGLGSVAVIAALVALAASAAAKQMVVTASTAPSLKVGQVVDGEATLALPSGAKVSLIGADGKPITLQGPYSGRPGQGGGKDDPALVSKLARLLDAKSGGDSNAIGAVRGGPTGRAVPADPWMVDIDGSGTTCVRAGKEPVLWRSDGAAPARMGVRRASAEGAATVTWAEGSDTAPWPAAVPVVSGEKYLIRMPNRSLPNVLQLREVPADLTSDAYRAVWMSENGCLEQARRLLGASR